MDLTLQASTEQDLHQILQRLIDEKQRVRRLEREIAHIRAGKEPAESITLHPDTKQGAVTAYESHDGISRTTKTAEDTEKAAEREAHQEKQIAVLKKMVEDLSRQLQTAQEAAKETQPQKENKAENQAENKAENKVESKYDTHSLTKARQELYLAQTDVREAKERIAFLEEEAVRLRNFRQTLQQEIKELTPKVQEAELTKKELISLKKRLQEQEEVLQKQKELSSRQIDPAFLETRLKEEKEQDEKLIQGLRNELESTKRALQEEKALHLNLVASSEKRAGVEEDLEHIYRVEAQLEDQKLIATELTKKNRDLEYAIQKIMQENVAAASAKEAKLEKRVHDLEQELESVKDALQQEKEHLKNEQDLARQQDLKIHELRKALLTLESEHEITIKEYERHADLLAEMENLAETREKELKETSERISLLEHHLARRVKECALLSKTQEENSIAIAELKNKISQLEAQLLETTRLLQEKEGALLDFKERSYQETKIREEKLQLLDQERKNLLQDIENKNRELRRLKEVEEKLTQVTQIFGQIGTIMTPTRMQAQPVAHIQYEPQQEQIGHIQESLFTPAARQVPPRKQDFFE